MIAHLVRAMLAALAASVLPGYYWAAVVRRTGGPGERLAYSAVLSMGSVPAIALALSWILGTGVTLVVAIASVLIVFASGALALRLIGPAAGPARPALPAPRPIRDVRVLALIIVATGLAAAAAASWPIPGWLLIATLAVAAAAGLLATAGRRRQRAAAGPAQSPHPPADAGPAQHPEPPAATGRRWGLRRAWPEWSLAVILALTAIRTYAGVAWHDWPNLRGQDMFSHAVMTEQMLAHGNYESYLIYPPGLSTMSAVICRLCGLPPLAMFAVVAPALLVLTTLAAYALATRLWGRSFGVAAAALSGLVLIGPYVSFSGGLYPDLLAAFFFMVMTVAALVTFFQSPTIRSGLLVTVSGGAVVLYHSVGTEYLAVLLAVTALACLPYLFLRGPVGRDLGRALIIAMAAVGFLSLAYAWRTYGLGELTGRGATTRDQVGLDVGSQPVLRAADVLNWVGSPIVWLGVFGFAALIVLVIRQVRQPGQLASALTVLIWAATMYAGSRLAIDGFPQRYERDVGAPLSILAAFGLVLVLQSLLQLWRARRRAAVPAGAGLPVRPVADAGLAVASPAQPEPAGAELAGAGLAHAELAHADLASAEPASAGSASAGSGGSAGSVLTGAPEATATAAQDSAADGSTAASTAPGSGQAGGYQADGTAGSGDTPAHPAVSGPAPARSARTRWALARPVLAVAAAVAVLAACAVQVGNNIHYDLQPSREVVPPGVAAAGTWLRQHNTGGTIISTPNLNRGVTNRAVLAMGGYTGLQSYPLAKIIHPRSLPTAGRQPLLDSRMVLLYPASCQSARILAADHVRYIFLYRFTNEANYDAFAATTNWYRPVFANRDVLIYQPVPGASC